MIDPTAYTRRAMWRRRRLLGPFYRGLLFLAGTTLWTCQVYFKQPDNSNNNIGVKTPGEQDGINFFSWQSKKSFMLKNFLTVSVFTMIILHENLNI